MCCIGFDILVGTWRPDWLLYMFWTAPVTLLFIWKMVQAYPFVILVECFPVSLPFMISPTAAPTHKFSWWKSALIGLCYRWESKMAKRFQFYCGIWPSCIHGDEVVKKMARYLASLPIILYSGDSSFGRASNWKACCNTDMNLSSWCGFFFQLTFSADFLTVSVLLCVQSNVSTSVRTLKTSNTGSHTIVWTQENTAHTARNGCAALAAAVTWIPSKGWLILSKIKYIKSSRNHSGGDSVRHSSSLPPGVQGAVKYCHVHAASGYIYRLQLILGG